MSARGFRDAQKTQKKSSRDFLSPASLQWCRLILGVARGMAPPSPDAPTTPPPEPQYAPPGLLAAGLAVIPNAVLWYGLSRGKNKLEVLVTGALRVGGIPALLTIPFLGMSMEKCFYDTLVSLQGCDPTYVPEEKRNQSFPSGGSQMFPSLSLVPVKHVREYFTGFAASGEANASEQKR